MGGQISSVMNETKRKGSKTERNLSVTRRAVQPAEPYWKRPSSYTPPPISIHSTIPAGVPAASFWAHMLETIFTQQSMLMREFDLRLRHLERNDTRASGGISFEHATWWMLWGILMLILGVTLIVVLVLVFQSR